MNHFSTSWRGSLLLFGLLCQTAQVKRHKVDSNRMQMYSYHPRRLVPFHVCLNSGWRSVACFAISHMLKHTEQVGFTTTRGPQCSLAHGRAEASHISISHTDKLAFSLPGRFPLEWMKCKRFGVGDVCYTAFQVSTGRRGGGSGGGVCVGGCCKQQQTDANSLSK